MDLPDYVVVISLDSEWDFAENHAFFRQTELQLQEYWRQKQIINIFTYFVNR